MRNKAGFKWMFGTIEGYFVDISFKKILRPTWTPNDRPFPWLSTAWVPQTPSTKPHKLKIQYLIYETIFRQFAYTEK